MNTADCYTGHHSCSEKSLRCDIQDMERCNRCPIPEHRKPEETCNRRATTAHSSGNCAQRNSCCKTLCTVPFRSWTSSCRRAKNQCNPLHHSAEVMCAGRRSPSLDRKLSAHNVVGRQQHSLPAKCRHHSALTKLHCSDMADEVRTLLSSTPSSQATFLISPRNRRMKKKKKKCPGHRKTHSDNSKEQDSGDRHQLKKEYERRRTLETKSEIIDPVSISRLPDCSHPTIERKQFPVKNETRMPSTSKITFKCGSRSSTPSSTSPPIVTMPRINERKCCSYNDLHEILGLEKGKEKETIETGSAIPSDRRRLQSAKIHREKKVQSNLHKDTTKLSNYFGQNLSPPNSKDSFHAKIDIVTSPINECSTTVPRTTNSQVKTKRSNEKPFHIFNLNRNLTTKTPTPKCMPLPVHPVARPNLAAILRTEHSQRKLKEFEKNCVYSSEWRKCSPLDWEIRKTDAWKALLLSDSHKDILAIRLATRQAEQALQRREYELNMELMRQRVKCSPLLLEGASNLNMRHSIRHNCFSENVSTCPRRQTRLKNCPPRSVSCCLSESNNTVISSNNGEPGPSTIETKPTCKDEQTQTQTIADRASRNKDQVKKFRTICRIYASHGCEEESDKRHLPRSSRANCCKCNHHRPPTPIVTCRPGKTIIQVRKRDAAKARSGRHTLPNENDSGDDLCSLDRALL